VQRLDEIWRRLTAFFRRGQFDRDLEDEMQFHLEMKSERNREAGIPVEEARHAARRQFGNATLLREQSRDAWAWRSAEDFLKDAKFALRTLSKNRSFAAVAVLTLALGIGITTAVFSFVDAALLKPLPFREPERLVELFNGRTQHEIFCSIRDLLEWRRVNQAFVDLAAEDMFPFTPGLAGGKLDYAEPVQAARVTANYFDVLGIQPVIGRSFLPDENEPGRDLAVILSNRLWRTMLGSAPNIAGRTVYVNGEPYVVAGVLPAGAFDRMETQIWVPMSFTPRLLTGIVWLRLVGRLKPGVTASEMSGLLGPKSVERGQKTTLLVLPLSEASVRKETRLALLLLAGAVGLVLLIACSNVAGLLLARAAARQGEIAIRLSLGAGRFRLVRLFLTESVVLFTAGGTLGTLLAIWVVRILKAAAPANFMPAGVEVAVDLRVLAFSFTVSLATSLVFGLAPALRFSGPRAARKLNENRAIGGHRIRSVMLVGQVALAFVLAIGAALTLNSLVRLASVDPGFHAGHLLTGQISINAKLYPGAPEMRNYIDQFMARLGGLPAVRSVAMANTTPFSVGLFDAPLYIDGGREKVGSMMWMVTPEYFDTMGIRLLRGRTISAFDRQGTPGAAVVDLTFARRYFGDADPLGRRFTSPILGVVEWTVVGVVAPVHFFMLGPEPWVGLYVPLAQLPPEGLAKWVRVVSFVARVEGDPSKLTPAVRSIAASLDKRMPVREIGTLEEAIDTGSIREPRFRTMLLTAFGGLALLLAAVGVYGVFHYSVVQRTREIGLRTALGAQASHIVGMILRQGMALVLLGVLIGLAGALALTRLLASMLFEVKPRDPATFVVVTLLVIVAAGFACYLPARRAARVDPMTALRHE
jgi:putative ABC transport system permease protein